MVTSVETADGFTVYLQHCIDRKDMMPCRLLDFRIAASKELPNIGPSTASKNWRRIFPIFPDLNPIDLYSTTQRFFKFRSFPGEYLPRFHLSDDGKRNALLQNIAFEKTLSDSSAKSSFASRQTKKLAHNVSAVGIPRTCK